MLDSVKGIARGFGGSLLNATDRLGIDVIVRYWQDHPVRARDAGWNAKKLQQVWAVRRALRPRIDPTVTRLWAVGLGVGMGIAITFLMAGFVFYRIIREMRISPSVM